jgi:alpha-methylacyl-CoA racemase
VPQAERHAGQGRGPLAGVRVVELAGLGPGPHGTAMLADMGCDVVSVVSPAQLAMADTTREATNPLSRGKRSVVVDLKDPDGVQALLSLTDVADVVVDPYRPGVCERLGIGPDVLCGRNPALVFARITGWGQDGPLAAAAGHDLNYLAVTGALHLFGYRDDEPPVMPLNVLADFAGGGMLLALGVSSALVERGTSGLGQVIDVAMVDGVASLVGPFYYATANGAWGPRGTNMLDGGAHFYRVYRTSDHKWMAVAAIEPQFYAALLDVLGFDDDPGQWERGAWPQWGQRMADEFANATRQHWTDRFAGTDACVTPVLDPVEAPAHAHMAGRGTVIDINGVPQAQVAPRFGRTPGAAGRAVHPGTHSVEHVVGSWRQVTTVRR